MKILMKKYLVGGAVRDFILNIPVKERDWVVIGETPKKMISLGYQQVGRKFPVFLHPISHEEYALARTELKISKGHNGFICKFSPDVTLEEDLKRRDLTINAIAKDEMGNLIDPYNGIKDLNMKLLRHVSDSFYEDPLRVLRVARFAARFAHLKFKVYYKTLNLMKKMSKELKYISQERIWKETKNALSTKNPHIYFKILKKCNALKIIFPEIDFLFNLELDNFFCNKKNAGKIILSKLSITSRKSNDIYVRFAILYNYVIFLLYRNKVYLEDIKKYILLINKFCNRLTVPKKLKSITQNLIKYYVYFLNNKITSTNLMNFFYSINAWRNPENLEKIISYIGIDKQIDSLIDKNLIIYAFNLSNLVKIDEIIKEGYTGENIAIKLKERRKLVLEIFVKNLISN